MTRFNKIAIIGVGLIGGSIGLAIKKKHIAGRVVGFFRRSSTMKKALKCKAVDSGTMDIFEAVDGADLIILATPVHLIPQLAAKVIRIAKKGAIITDAGSTKGWIVAKIENLIKIKSGVFFVGSHPMAGSEHAGVEFAKVGLFNGSPCIITKTSRTDNKALAKIIGFWNDIGTNVSVMDPSQHDRSVALISHLPHIVAFSLAGAVPVEELAYAAEGFKDTTRVASSDPMLWADIFFTNKRELIKSAKMFDKFYRRLIAALSKNDSFEMIKLLSQAKTNRDKLKYAKSH